jgi:transposase-like protein
MKDQIPLIEEVKRLNLVDFLNQHYGLEFSRTVGVSNGVAPYCCRSPFTGEQRGSFFVREVDGHWLFKDFSSGHGGSLIDFILLKEGFSEVSESLSYITNLLPGENENMGVNTSSSPAPPNPSGMGIGYDIEGLYNKFRRNDVGPCRSYLQKRGISKDVLEKISDSGMLVHNIYKGNSYCCFAVFNESGQLCCLDNHCIGGEGKFVLGHKHPFSFDWKELPVSERVFVAESVIDYLSLKTLEGPDFHGLALLGNVINFNSELFSSAHAIISALDGDPAGFKAFLDLEEAFNDKIIEVYDFGDSKDANEYLEKRNIRKLTKRLSAEDKLALYRDFYRSDNKSEVARRWGINRSHMYHVINECEELLLTAFSQRRPGRKSKSEPTTIAEARERLDSLESQNRLIDEERERYYVRNEFMKVRLKWAEREVADLRGEVSKSKISKNKKKTLKKKRKKKS